MEMLKITSLRPGANPNNPQAPNAVNYDEAKANPYPILPDPLTLKNGKKVTSAKMWWNQRRPEIVEDFDREVYGRVPKNVPKVKWEVTNTTKEMKFDLPGGKRRQIQSEANRQWAALTADDLRSFDGKRDNLVNLLENRYGFAKRRAEREAEWFFSQFEDRLRQAT